MYGHLSECIRDYMDPSMSFGCFHLNTTMVYLDLSPTIIDLLKCNWFIDDNDNLELLSSAKNVDCAEVFLFFWTCLRILICCEWEWPLTTLNPPTCVLAPKSTLCQLAIDALNKVYSTTYGRVLCENHSMLTALRKFSHIVAWQAIYLRLL